VHERGTDEYGADTELEKFLKQHSFDLRTGDTCPDTGDDRIAFNTTKVQSKDDYMQRKQDYQRLVWLYELLLDFS
jgi:hypothetical protein